MGIGTKTSNRRTAGTRAQSSSAKTTSRTVKTNGTATKPKVKVTPPKPHPKPPPGQDIFAGGRTGSTGTTGGGFELQLNTSKIRADYDARVKTLDAECSPAALSKLRSLLHAGHTGYIYGDGGSMLGTLGELKRMASQVGAPAVPADLVKRVDERGALVDMQSGLSEANYRKAADGTFMQMGLSRAIRAAQRLDMGTAELTDYLKAYGLTRKDVEANTDFRFP
jgi:hypothetical protein